MSDSTAPVPKTLYRWQRDDRRGGDGGGEDRAWDSRGGHAARDGRRGAVVIPTRELMYQWARGRELPMVELGLLGDGHRGHAAPP